ncbi:MAG: hypothetical protein V4687_15955 [Bacteroidota bacterium]
MNQQDQNELLAKAARDFPIGTKFIIPVLLQNRQPVSDADHECYSVRTITTADFKWGNADNIYADHRDDEELENGCVYYEGQWAEIVSKPEGINIPSFNFGDNFEIHYSKLKSRYVDIKTPLDGAFYIYTTDTETDRMFNIKIGIEGEIFDWSGSSKELYSLLKPKEASQPLDIEKDKRYLDLLDEEALKLGYENYIVATKSQDTTDEEMILESTIKLSAQRKYFELLLSEKSAEYDYWINKKNKQQDEYLKREREANITISQQAKEIEELKQELKAKL